MSADCGETSSRDDGDADLATRSLGLAVSALVLARAGLDALGEHSPGTHAEARAMIALVELALAGTVAFSDLPRRDRRAGDEVRAALAALSETTPE